MSSKEEPKQEVATKPDQKIDQKQEQKVSDSKSEDGGKEKSAEFKKKKQTFIVRTTWTIIMVVGMFSILFLGPIWVIGLVLMLQILTFKEVIALSSRPAREKELPLNRTLSWYFLATSAYYLDGESFIHHFKHIIFVDKYLTPLASNHRFLSYCLYVLGFVCFVATLKPGSYKMQFAQLCVTHMVLILVVFQAHLIISNILTGLFWFLLPVGLVIVNDIFAYICGITFGKTQLIAISPKKTVEGFVGAWGFTIMAAFLLVRLLCNYNYLICPVEDLSSSILSNVTCDPNPVFVPQSYRLPPAIGEFFNQEFVVLKPIYFHAIVYATFASLIAPFGGFFASGVKRTFNIKDFGDTIPGHGGITDRMDCQFLMGSFSYLYYETFISTHRVTVGSVLQMAVSNLQPAEILQLILSLQTYLHSSGVIDDTTLRQLTKPLKG